MRARTPASFHPLRVRFEIGSGFFIIGLIIAAAPLSFVQLT
jgi:hypothetical protein